MIVTEIVTINGKEYQHTYSDAGRTVVREGIAYSEAIDPIDSGRVYTEGDYLVDEDITDIEAKAKGFEVLVGVSE